MENWNHKFRSAKSNKVPGKKVYLCTSFKTFQASAHSSNKDKLVTDYNFEK